MSEHERRAGEAALARLFAAMVADETFMEAEAERQRNVTRGNGQ